MNEKITDRKWRSEKQKCLLWGFVPVFDFFAFFLMADNSGQDKYRRKGRVFAAITLTAFMTAVSGDLLMYFTTVTMGLRAAAYTRSLIIVAGITVAASYFIQLILIGLTRKEYLIECSYIDEVSDCRGMTLEKKGETEERGTDYNGYDLNACSREEIQELPGIDAALAIRILEDREEYGGYASVDEFIDRYDIKPHFAAKIMDMAYVSESSNKMKHPLLPPGSRPVRAIDI